MGYVNADQNMDLLQSGLHHNGHTMTLNLVFQPSNIAVCVYVYSLIHRPLEGIFI